MFYFPIVNIFVLILIYRVHRKIFWITTIIETILFLAGSWYIETTYQTASNQFLYTLTLTGIGLIIGVAAFFIAISINHKGLYENLSHKDS